MLAGSLFALTSLAACAFGQSPATLTTPASLVQCQPALLTISGGTGPYFVTVIPGGEVRLPLAPGLGGQIAQADRVVVVI